jgi:hypothetical protein
MFKSQSNRSELRASQGASMARAAMTGNVLTWLDEQPPSRFYWRLTLLATVGGLLFGYDTANIGSALNFVSYGLHGLPRATWCPERRSAPPSARSWPVRPQTGSAARHC